MPMINCPTCGEQTNSALCPGGMYNANPRAKCWLTWTGNGWKKGCGYDELDTYDKIIADEYLKQKERT